MRHPVVAVLALVSLAGAPVRAQNPPPPDDGLNAVLWVQTSVEAQANAIGAFALAKLRLDQALADKSWTAAPSEQTGNFKDLPPAVVVDVDETLVSTAPYQAWTIKNQARFRPNTWARYVKARRDTAIPGAVDFTTYATGKGVKVFYVSNRSVDEKAATIEELKSLGFPVDAGLDTFLAQKQQPSWLSAKGTRRAFVAKSHRILLIVGAQLGDFTDRYKGDLADRQKVFDEAAAHWGHDWIMLANPTYGSFEAAPYGGDGELQPGEKRTRKIGALKPWDGQ